MTSGWQTQREINELIDRRFPHITKASKDRITTMIKDGDYLTRSVAGQLRFKGQHVRELQQVIQKPIQTRNIVMPQRAIVQNRFLSAQDLESLSARSTPKTLRGYAQKQIRVRNLPQQEFKHLLEYIKGLRIKRLERYWQQQDDYHHAKETIPLRYDLKRLVKNLGDDYAYIIENIGTEFKRRRVERYADKNIVLIDLDDVLSVIKACPYPRSEPFRTAIAKTAIRVAIPSNLTYQDKTDIRTRIILTWSDLNKTYNIDRSAIDILEELIQLMSIPEFARFKKTIQEMIIICIWYFIHVKRVHLSQEIIHTIITRSNIRMDQLIV